MNMWNKLAQKAGQSWKYLKIFDFLQHNPRLRDFWLYEPRFWSVSPNTWSRFLWFLGDRKAWDGVISQDFGCSHLPSGSTRPPTHHPPKVGAGLILRTERDRCCCTISGHQLANVGFKHWKKEQQSFALEKEPHNLSSLGPFFNACQRHRVLVKYKI